MNSPFNSRRSPHEYRLLLLGLKLVKVRCGSVRFLQRESKLKAGAAAADTFQRQLARDEQTATACRRFSAVNAGLASFDCREKTGFACALLAKVSADHLTVNDLGEKDCGAAALTFLTLHKAHCERTLVRPNEESSATGLCGVGRAGRWKSGGGLQHGL